VSWSPRGVLLGPAALATLLVLGACAPRPVQRSGWTGEMEIDRLLQADAERLQGLTDLTAEVHFWLHEVGSASGSLLFQPPSLLRLDVRGPLFRRIFSAVLDGDELTAVANDRIYQMPAHDGLDVFLDIDLGGYDPRLALLGLVAPASIGIDKIEYPRADRARVTINDGIEGQRRRLWFDLHTGFVQREELVTEGGQVRWIRQLSEWRVLPGTDVYLPKRVRVESQDRVLELEYLKIRVDRGLQRVTFFQGIADP
jgi:hypothetical protein